MAVPWGDGGRLQLGCAARGTLALQRDHMFFFSPCRPRA